MAQARIRTPVVVGLILALGVALAYYMYRDLTSWSRHYRVVRVVAPCDADDTTHKVTETREGKFCIEPDTEDSIKKILLGGMIWENNLVEVFKQHVHAGDVVVDAGAYIGEHTMQLSKLVGPKGKVIAFEPQLRIYQELLVNLDLNQIGNVQAEFVALGDVNQRVSMSAAKDTNEGGTTIGTGNNRVELRTLDSYRLEKVAFIKIDVEGYEQQLLEGARETIKRDRPKMVIEIWPRNRAKVMPLLDELGYTTQEVGSDDFLAVPKAETK